MNAFRGGLGRRLVEGCASLLLVLGWGCTDRGDVGPADTAADEPGDVGPGDLSDPGAGAESDTRDLAPDGVIEADAQDLSDSADALEASDVLVWLDGPHLWDSADTLEASDVLVWLDGPPAPVERPELTIETYPRVDGSTSNLPMARVIACELLGLAYHWVPGEGEEAQIVPTWTTPEEQVLADAILATIVHHRTHDAFMRLIDGDTDLILVASAPSPDERAHAAEVGVALELAPVALDALIFMVSADNSVEGLTTEEIQGIYTGAITRWEEVGGADAPIDPYVRPENSGSQQLMDTLVMAGLPSPAWPEDRTPGLMGALVDALMRDENAIGYSVYYYVTYQYPIVGLKILAVDGYQPEPPTIGARTYPFTAEVWVVTRQDLDPNSLAHQLRDWLLTPDGQEVVSHSGYVPASP